MEIVRHVLKLFPSRRAEHEMHSAESSRVESRWPDVILSTTPPPSPDWQTIVFFQYNGQRERGQSPKKTGEKNYAKALNYVPANQFFLLLRYPALSCFC